MKKTVIAIALAMMSIVLVGCSDCTVTNNVYQLDDPKAMELANARIWTVHCTNLVADVISGN